MEGWSNIALSILVPYVICYLAHTQTTRLWRVVILPIGFLAAYGVIRSEQLERRYTPTLRLAITAELIMLHPGCATRWAIAKSPPVYEPTLETPYFASVRSMRWFRALSLMLNGHRHVGIQGHTQLQPRRKSVTGYLILHFAWLMVHLKAMQEANAAVGILSTVRQSSQPDLQVILDATKARTGIPTWIIRIPCSLLVAVWLHAAMSLFYHSLAILGLSSGLWTGEEYPRNMDWPIKSDSLGQLWGKRYHQWNRDLYKLWAEPARKLGKDVWIIAIFTISAAQHSLVYPLASGDSSAILPWTIFLVGSGMGLVLERRYYKMTGIKVGGWPGRIWMWTWLVLMSERLTYWFWRHLIETGSIEGNRQFSAVAWLTYAAGVAPTPA